MGKASREETEQFIQQSDMPEFYRNLVEKWGFTVYKEKKMMEVEER